MAKRLSVEELKGLDLKNAKGCCTQESKNLKIINTIQDIINDIDDDFRYKLDASYTDTQIIHCKKILVEYCNFLMTENEELQAQKNRILNNNHIQTQLQLARPEGGKTNADND